MKAQISTQEQAYLRLRSVVQGFNNVLTNHRSELDADISNQRIMILFQDLRRRQVEVQALLGTSGISAFAKQVQNDAGYNLTADLSALNVFVNAVRDECKSLAVNPDGSINEKILNAQDTYDFPEILVADLGDLRTAVDATIANIEV